MLTSTCRPTDELVRAQDVLTRWQRDLSQGRFRAAWTVENLHISTAQEDEWGENEQGLGDKEEENRIHRAQETSTLLKKMISGQKDRQVTVAVTVCDSSPVLLNSVGLCFVWELCFCVSQGCGGLPSQQDLPWSHLLLSCPLTKDILPPGLWGAPGQ